ncbi:hypothetical protein [Flammeovirga kamogawensis]|uniref:Cell shape-determining protein n=1 Tax=Flammeovirga kamogawensis TaxID=373891 RepID=A0ABX8GU79_9BACT|nr:hypothetical protein [Flammeovirga kamogawensis]MBB6459794.1 hypothetical protein [Flammeovirga kamogawensis]QWG07149.1 hypothetical protein KM029_17885 [Flammeovirga kamogawensis]TRX68971.1 hypothetical protein EO216_12875 [Flammeovirga kamogawensis]
MKYNIFYLLILLLLLTVSFYIILPTLAYGFTSWAMLLFFISGVFVFLETARIKQQPSTIRNVGVGVMILSLLYAIVLPLFTSWALFRSEDYKNLIGEVKKGENFTNHVAPISTEEIRIVDNDMADRLGDKVLGSIPSLGSQAHLGQFSIQKVKGKLYWVAPLMHSGFFKWNNNKEGTPGYVMVSATNERDVTLVQEVDGEPVKIKYQSAAFFMSDLERHIYLNGYMTKGFTDYSFEIDDNGKPYWIITLYDKEVGFSGDNATGVLTVDVANGEIKEYSIEDTPIWIDRIQPENFIVNQLDDWGEFVLGYFNFSNERKLTTTKGMSLVYGSNDRAYWYTGLTSVGNDEGTVGFVLVDTRTKETIWYKQVGATEQAARQSAMGKVQEKGYYASFPITYNINGIPTYVMSLKDNAGLIKMIAMVSVEDYTIVGVGNNIKEALRAYKNSINSRGNSVIPNSYVNTFVISSTISRIKKDIRNGTTNYYIMVDDLDSKIFIGSSLISSELPITQVGDSVNIKYDDGANELVDIVSFDNLNIQLRKTTKKIQN